jgi:hypothetical protein
LRSGRCRLRLWRCRRAREPACEAFPK